jgi:glycosyltransferase involved in cell wall biosynthesis
MRVLFISTVFPSDLQRSVYGVFKRAEMHIDALKDIAELSMLYYVPPNIDVSPSAVTSVQEALSKRWGTDVSLYLCNRKEAGDADTKWFRYGAGIFNFFEQPPFRATSGKTQLDAMELALQSSPDLVFVHRLPAMCPLLLINRKLPRVVFDLDDIEHISLLRSARRISNLRDKILAYLYVPALAGGERRAIQMASETFVCSDRDREYLAKRLNLKRVSVIPNALELVPSQPNQEEQTILFLGNFQYDPNVQAARFLIEHIWPRVRSSCPNARLILAGDRPGRIGHSIDGNSGIEFAGFVDNLDELYRRSRVVAVPIFAGSGTRIKIIEAAAYGKPIVATSIGAEGLELRNERDLLIRNNAAAFAEACILLLEKREICDRLGSAAKEAVASRYDRRNVVSLVQSRITEIVGRA